VKLIRFLLIALATAFILALVLVGAAFAPPVQTWFARMELLDQPGVQGSLGSLSASLGKVEVEDVDLQFGGIVLKMPLLQARLPMVEAVWHKKILVGTVVAKGWTLDLSGVRDRELEVPAQAVAEGPGPASVAPVTPERRAALALGGVLAGRMLPFDSSLDGVDLDGDVLVSASPGNAPVRFHVTATGGGMAKGREGSFVIDASRVPGTSDSPGASTSAHCQLTLSMDSPRTFDRAEVKADLSGTIGSQRVDITVAAAAAQTRGADGETYTVDLSRGDRHLATLLANFPDSSRRLSGKWKVDLRDADLAPFLSGRNLPSVAAAGTGNFDADAAFENVHAIGRLVTVASKLGMAEPVLDRLGIVTVDSRFDVTRGPHSFHVESLAASIACDRPVAVVTALQPFDLDWETGAVKVGNPHLDWVDVAIRDFPLERFPVLPGGVAFTAGSVHCEFTVHASDGGLSIRQTAPLSASGISMERSGRTVARDLELSVSMQADCGLKQWQFQWSPVAIDCGGRRLADIDAKGTRPSGVNQPLAFSGAWKADLDALASMPGLSWITGRAASGEFTGSLGSSSEIEVKAVVVGHDPTHTVSTTVNADEDANGAGELLAPMKVEFGASVSDISAEVSWGADSAEPRSEIKLSGDSVALGHLRLLAAPLAAAGGAALPDRASGTGAGWAQAGVRDRLPFWGDWVGRVAIAFEKLRTGDQDFADVGGTFEIDRNTVRLEGGHAELPSKNIAKLEGSILFDASGARPYVLTGSASALSKVDSALLLPARPGEDPVIEGHFTATAALSGTGVNLDDLVAGTQEEFQLDGTNGIIRLLRTDIADVIPEAKEPVSDTLGDVGNLVGSVLLGIKGHSIDPAKNKVGKIPETVINFTNQVAEIGYDRIAVTAIRGSDRSIRLAKLEMTSPDAHLKGTGTISYVRGVPVSMEPLSVELQLGVHDQLATLLSTVGLLSPGKDELGFSLLREPVRFGGTLDRIDDKPWHDLLAKAATQKPPADKKASSAGSR
jgi:hypothetical protein